MTTTPAAHPTERISRPRRPRARRFAAGTVAVLLFGTLGLIYATLGVGNPYVGFLADDALYLLMADILSPWQAATLPVYDHVRAHSQLPSLFPLVIGLAGGGTENLAIARLVVAASMLGAVAACLEWLAHNGVDRPAGLALTILFAVMPITWLHVVDLWSEGLFICLSLLSLTAFDVARDRCPGAIGCFATGVLVGCAIATRSVGVALIPAMFVVCLQARVARAWWMWPGLASMLAAGMLIDMGQGGTSYLDLLRSRYAGAPFTELAGQLGVSAHAALEALPYVAFQWRDPNPTHWVLIGTVMLVAAVGFGVAMRALRPGAVYVLAYGAIIAVWPYPQLMDRLLFPLVPLGLLFVYDGAAKLGRLVDRPVAITRSAIVVLVMMAAPGIAATIAAATESSADPDTDTFRYSRYRLDPTRADREQRAFGTLRSLHDALPGIARHVQADACIHTVLTNLVLLHAKRIAVLPPREDVMTAGNPDGCEFYYVTSMPFRGRPPLYPYPLIEQQVEVVSADHAPAANGADAPLIGVLLRRRQVEPAGGGRSADFE